MSKRTYTSIIQHNLMEMHKHNPLSRAEYEAIITAIAKVTLARAKAIPSDPTVEARLERMFQ